MSIEESTLGLAGIFQAAQLVKQLARKGQVNEQGFSTCMHSLLKIDASSTLDVFGEISDLRIGLDGLNTQFGTKQAEKDTEVLRYVLGIMVLERHLSKRQDMLQLIQQGVGQAVEQAKLFGGPTHSNVVARFADLYAQTLSTFSYRIYVHGEPMYLQNTESANKVRALLLAGVRSAVLWRQKGGGRLQLFFQRRKILQQAQQYLLEA